MTTYGRSLWIITGSLCAIIRLDNSLVVRVAILPLAEEPILGVGVLGHVAISPLGGRLAV